MNKQIILVVGWHGMTAEQQAQLTEKIKEHYPADDYDIMDNDDAHQLMGPSIMQSEVIYPFKIQEMYTPMFDGNIVKKQERERKQQDKYRSKYHSR